MFVADLSAEVSSSRRQTPARSFDGSTHLEELALL